MYVPVLRVKRRWVDDELGVYKTMSIPMIAAFLRLGRKYEIDHLRKLATKRLSHFFPSRLQDMGSVPSNAAIMINIKRGDLLTCANIIRENDLLLFLPSALYLCLVKDKTGAPSLFHPVPEMPQPILPLHDIQLCLQAYDKISRLQTTETFSWLCDGGLASDCSRSVCATSKKILCRKYLYAPAPFLPFVSWKDDWEIGLCDNCVSKSRASHNKGRQNAWDQLPSAFALPDWEELRLKWSTVRQSFNSASERYNLLMQSSVILCSVSRCRGRYLMRSELIAVNCDCLKYLRTW